MKTYTEALSDILRGIHNLGNEQLPLEQAMYRVLSEDVYSEADMPPFNKAAVDGFACRRADLGGDLKVIETIAAGSVPQKSIGGGECARIMTGAMVPEGADTVLMLEHTMETAPETIRFIEKETTSNFVKRGEETKLGDVVLEKGTHLFAQHLAVLASQGKTNPLVSKRPVVAIMSTGDELVEPSVTPQQGQIRNSNSTQLIAQTINAHAVPKYHGIIADNLQATQHAISNAIAQSDIILISGGVSVGDFDMVPQALRSLGIEVVFQKVAIKPGKPTLFARKGNCSIFGLPGNPVSSFINFEIFVKPLIYALMGARQPQHEVLMPMGIDFYRNKADRMEYLPVNIDSEGAVRPVVYHGSAHIHALCFATAIMVIPKGKNTLSKGELVYVRPISS
ncbi:MAG TPA: molybdopterin molybdenumtransferase MoeA [Bacteroidales bacterium]|nr:molybdopterin molybdenumtransferase MoeA [Bacteroidales bacterium]